MHGTLHHSIENLKLELLDSQDRRQGANWYRGITIKSPRHRSRSRSSWYAACHIVILCCKVGYRPRGEYEAQEFEPPMTLVSSGPSLVGRRLHIRLSRLRQLTGVDNGLTS